MVELTKLTVNPNNPLDPKYVDVIRKRYAKFIGKEDEWETITLAL